MMYFFRFHHIINYASGEPGYEITKTAFETLSQGPLNSNLNHSL